MSWILIKMVVAFKDIVFIWKIYCNFRNVIPRLPFLIFQYILYKLFINIFFLYTFYDKTQCCDVFT